MSIYYRDRTMNQPTGGAGMGLASSRVLYLCGHVGAKIGGHFRRPGGGGVLYLRCPACNAKGTGK